MIDLSLCAGPSASIGPGIFAITLRGRYHIKHEVQTGYVNHTRSHSEHVAEWDRNLSDLRAQVLQQVLNTHLSHDAAVVLCHLQ